MGSFALHKSMTKNRRQRHGGIAFIAARAQIAQPDCTPANVGSGSEPAILVNGIVDNKPIYT